MHAVTRVFGTLLDAILAPVVLPAALLMKAVRRVGVQRLPLCRRALLAVGVFPVRNHYYEPLIDHRALKKPLGEPRRLPGINWNDEEQLRILDSFAYAEELRGLPITKTGELEFHLANGAFESGDAEYLYSMIRLKKPARIVEVGSGNSTLMAMKAVRRNRDEDPAYRCHHVCIEPYEMPWLEKTGVDVIRQRVEEVDLAVFAELGPNDLLFIDSSHVIRPQGDVLFEYLELLPTLRPGVIVHVHDVFSPRDYLHEWIVDEVKLWNEQYVLEAFLTGNRDWKILGALNYLHHTYPEQLRKHCPYLTREREPGSFYIQRMGYPE